jgi:hypothetical protein
MRITGGTGNGYSAKVSDENRLYVHAVSETGEHHANHSEGTAFNAICAVNPDGAADVIFYLKNTGEKDIVIEGVWWQTSAAEEVYYRLGDTGTAVATSGAAITPANLNAGSGEVADVTCYSNTGEGAVDITGLTAGVEIQRLWLSDAKSVWFNAEQDIIVPKNKAFSILAVGGDTLLRFTVSFNVHNAED